MSGLGFMGVRTGPIREDEFDALDPDDFAERFGFALEAPSDRERRAHRAARPDLANRPAPLERSGRDHEDWRSA